MSRANPTMKRTKRAKRAASEKPPPVGSEWQSAMGVRRVSAVVGDTVLWECLCCAEPGYANYGKCVTLGQWNAWAVNAVRIDKPKRTTRAEPRQAGG